jgi:hypothetical protein
MEIALFVLGILLLISCVATSICLYYFFQVFKAHCEDFTLLADNIAHLISLQESRSAKILELGTENATLKSELVALQTSNEDLTKSIEILSAQYLK